MSRKQFEELEEIQKPSGVFSDKFYIVQRMDTVRIVFCEDTPPELGSTTARSAIVLTLNGFFNLSKMLSEHAKKLEDDLASQQQPVKMPDATPPWEDLPQSSQPGANPDYTLRINGNAPIEGRPTIDKDGKMRY